MRRSWLPLLALSGVIACSVYSESLLSGGSSSTLDSGPPEEDSGSPQGGKGGTGGSGAAGGSGSSGSGSSGGSGGNDGGADSGIGDGGCVGSGGSDAMDCCPSDDAKTDPGVCGCGTPDADGDGDEVFDCEDACPMDMGKSEPGACGCGVVDSVCAEVGAALLHRYSFEGTGTEATDSIGVDHGTVVNTTLSGGAVTLGGGTTNQYVDLPNGIISSLTNATFEAWATWPGGAIWQRLFDFGDQNTTAMRSYLFLSMSATTGFTRAAITTSGPTNETRIDPMVAISPNVQNHIALVFDDTGNTMTLYVEGAMVGTPSPVTIALSAINDVNNWLGRSQFDVDPEFGGTIAEFRIYGSALSTAQVETSFAMGPDAVFPAP